MSNVFCDLILGQTLFSAHFSECPIEHLIFTLFFYYHHYYYSRACCSVRWRQCSFSSCCPGAEGHCGGGGAVFFSLIISIMLRRLIIYSGSTAPCSPLHNWKPRGHVGVRDHLPGGGPPAFILWPTSHAVCLCWTEPGVKMHLDFMYCIWKWSKIEFCFETWLRSKFSAAGLILCDERIVASNWSDRNALMRSAVRWSKTAFFSQPLHVMYAGEHFSTCLMVFEIIYSELFSSIWTNFVMNALLAWRQRWILQLWNMVRVKLDTKYFMYVYETCCGFLWLCLMFELVAFNPSFSETHFRSFLTMKIKWNGVILHWWKKLKKTHKKVATFFILILQHCSMYPWSSIVLYKFSNNSYYRRSRVLQPS